jgi:predicted transcriptional regulator
MLSVKVPKGQIQLTPYQSHVYKALLESQKPISWRALADIISWNSPSSVRTAVEQLCRFGLVERRPNKGGDHWWLYTARRA